MEIARGEITKTVYSLIKQEKFSEAVEILEQLLDLQPSSRAALSLLGYCNFQLQDFDNSATYYDRLSNLYPDIPEYQYYLAQSLYNTNNYEAALSSSYLRGDPDTVLEEKVVKLQAGIQFCRNEMEDTKALVEKCKKDDPDTEVMKGCLAYTDGNYSEAGTHFENASKILGMNSDELLEPLIWYNRAVTSYQKGDLPNSADFIGDIIEHGAVNFPELKMGVNKSTEDLSSCVQSVGNSRTLHKSALIETLNLKAAVEYDLKKVKSARDTLKDIPPRLDEELDATTLHNLAILNDQSDPLESLKKLRYLLEQEDQMFPPETFVNLLILYWRYEHFDLMADLMAVYEDYKIKYVHPVMRRFFESLIKREVAPNEATKEIEEQCHELAKSLLEMVKKVTDIKVYGNEDEVRTVCNEFDDLIDGTYMPMLLTLGKIYWDQDDLTKVEDILRLGAEFLDDRDPWLINCAHVVFRHGNDFKEAAGLYELVVRKYQHELLQVSAGSLANLVVCYVHIGRNDEAEKLINKIEAHEAYLLESHKGVKVFHSCIMSLVIGTLYCVKSNYKFGMDRMFLALMDFKTKLGPDTWFYAKSCILSLISRLVKINLTVTQQTVTDTMVLLLQCEEHGRDVTTVIEETSANPQMEECQVKSIPSNFGTKTVAYEARYLQYLLNQVQELVFM